MTTNKKMNELINGVIYDEKRVIDINLKELNELFNPKFVVVQDCILISTKTAQELERSLSCALKIHTNKSWYEASNSDTRINDFIENSITVKEVLAIGILIADIWGLRLKKIDSKSKFCIIITCDEGYVTIRYHKIRANEANWLLDNLEEYEEPVGYLIT